MPNPTNASSPYYKYQKDKVELLPVRVIDDNTHQEYFRIEISVDGKSSGQIECHAITMERDLRQLREYGTGFLRQDIIEFRKDLEKHYWDVYEDHITHINPIDENLQNLIDMYSDYITTCGSNNNFESVENVNKIYNMPVTDFTDYFESSDYCDLDIKYFRKKLKDGKYIEANRGRTDRDVRLSQEGTKENKPIRCISFNIEGKKEKANQGQSEHITYKIVAIKQ